MAQATITGLNVYPVKSCRGTALEKAQIGLAGIEGDRRWMVISDTGRFLTQREMPRLALIIPKVDARGVILTAQGMPDLAVPDQPAGAEAGSGRMGRQMPGDRGESRDGEVVVRVSCAAGATGALRSARRARERSASGPARCRRAMNFRTASRCS